MHLRDNEVTERRLGKADEVARILDVPEKTVYRLGREVFPPGVVVRIGRKVRFDLEELNTWIAKGGSR